MEDISEKFTINIPGEGKVLQLAFAVVFFYKISEDRGRKAAIVDILDEHCEMTGNKYRWTQNPKTYTWKRLKDGINSYTHPRDWAITNKDYRWTLIYHAGEKASDASDIEVYSFNIGDQSKQSNGTSFVRVHFPITVLENAPAVCEWIQDWSELLKPDHGYAGFCLAQSHGYERGEAMTYEYAIAQRFPGIDIYTNVGHSLQLGNYIKGVNWLTILSDIFLERIGGLEAVKEQMGELPVLTYAGGAILQAGALPQFGDTEQNISMTAYKRVAGIVEPLRHRNYGRGAGMLGPGPKLTHEAYREWLARFSPQPR